MVELRPVDLAHCVAMGVDMDKADGPVMPQSLQDRIGYRMVAANRQRPHPGRLDAPVERLDILDAAIETEARAHRHIADIGGLAFCLRHDTEGVIVRPDALGIAHRTRS